MALSTDVAPLPVLPRNYVHGCLLLLLAESPTHGYDLIEQLSQLGLANVDSSAVYRSLRGLDADGFVESSWEEAHSGPSRRRYHVTPAGLACLEEWASSVAAGSSTLTVFLARHRRLRRAAGLAVRTG